MMIWDRPLDEKLYCACLDFCREYTIYMGTRNMISNNYASFTLMEQRKLLEYDESRVKKSFKELSEIITELKKE